MTKAQLEKDLFDAHFELAITLNYTASRLRQARRAQKRFPHSTCFDQDRAALPHDLARARSQIARLSPAARRAVRTMAARIAVNDLASSRKLYPRAVPARALALAA